MELTEMIGRYAFIQFNSGTVLVGEITDAVGTSVRICMNADEQRPGFGYIWVNSEDAHVVDFYLLEDLGEDDDASTEIHLWLDSPGQ
jgi:hypothetical protein